MIQREVVPLRPVIVVSVTVCVAVAMAPWFSGGQEPEAMLISALALLLGVLLLWRQPEVRRLQWGGLSVGWIGLVGFALLSLLWSANRYSSVAWAAEWTMAGIAFWLAFVIAGEKGGRQWLVRAYLLSATLFGVAALWLFFNTAYPRLTGAFYWPNPAAAYLMPAILICLDRLRGATRRRMYGWWGATTGFLVLFLLTDSRAATLILAILVLVYLALVKLSRAYWIKLVFIVAVAVAMSVGLNWLSTKVAHHRLGIVPGSRFAEVAGGEPTSFHDRVNYLVSGVSMWVDHPVGGTGAGTYGDVHPYYQKNVVSASKNAHNFVVQTLAELGAVGLLLVVVLVLSAGAGVLRGLTEQPGMMSAALGVAGVVVHFGLDIDASYPSLVMLVAVLIGMTYSQGLERRAPVRLGAVALSAAVLVPLVSLYESSMWAARAGAAQVGGDYTEAAADFASAHHGVAYNPDYINAEGIDWYTLAGLGDKSATQDLALALDRAELAESQDPYDGQNYQLQGRVLAEKRDFGGAVAALQQALRRDPFDHPGYALDMATFQLLRGDGPGALKTAQSMLALYPQSVVNNRNLDQTLRPTLANLEALVGNVDLQQGDVAGANRAAQRALALDKNSLRGRALQVQVNKKLHLGV